MDKPKNIISYKIRNTLFNYLRNKGYFVHESTGRTLLIEFFKRLFKINACCLQESIIQKIDEYIPEYAQKIDKETFYRYYIDDDNYVCKYECGYRGTYTNVLEHEKTCKCKKGGKRSSKRSKRSSKRTKKRILLPKLKPINNKNVKHKYKLSDPQNKRILAINEGINMEAKKIGKTIRKAAISKKGRFNILRIYRKNKRPQECKKITSDMKYIDKKYKLGDTKNICKL